MEVKEFKPKHLESFEIQARQAFDKKYPDWYGPTRDCPGRKLSIFAQGKLVAVIGCLWSEGWPYGWAILSREAGKHLLGLTKICRRMIAVHGRFKVLIRRDWKEAARWARLLGFERGGLTAIDADYDFWTYESEAPWAERLADFKERYGV